MSTTAPAAGAAGAPVSTRYEVVIGVEIHVQLKTASKMFCACSTDVRGAAPNTLTCPVCLGLPGALPVINRRAVEHVLATGLAIGASIPEITRWDRKNYFYPDLPKGYQISQYDLPLSAGGSLSVSTSEGQVEIGSVDSKMVYVPSADTDVERKRLEREMDVRCLRLFILSGSIIVALLRKLDRSSMMMLVSIRNERDLMIAQCLVAVRHSRTRRPVGGRQHKNHEGSQKAEHRHAANTAPIRQQAESHSAVSPAQPPHCRYIVAGADPNQTHVGVVARKRNSVIAAATLAMSTRVPISSSFLLRGLNHKGRTRSRWRGHKRRGPRE